MTKNNLLIKLAINMARRGFLLGAASKLFGKAPELASTANKNVMDNMMSFAIPGSGVGRTMNTINKINNHGISLARWRAYRTQVKRGVPHEVALMKVYADQKMMPVTKKIVRLKQAGTIKNGLDTVADPKGKVLEGTKGLSMVDKAKKLFSNTRGALRDVYDSGALISRNV